MEDEYTLLKRDLEEIEAMIRWFRANIPPLIAQYERSDHPLKRENIARLHAILDRLPEV